MRVLVTGAAGGVATLLRPRLRGDGRILRLLDIAPPDTGGDEVMTGSVTDPEVMAVACHDVDAVIHLGGHSRENSWADTVEVNITGTQTVLEAARRAGVRRVILASSNHAVGFREVTEELPADSTPRPDTFYGVSKAAMEALGSLYHSRFGMDVICIRIGSCFERPPGVRGLSTWLSPDDAGRLFKACLTFASPGYRIVWGVSDNTRRVYSLAEAEALGYRSEDDAEKFADEITDAPPAGTEARYVGGPFTTIPLGGPN
ncbi:NAD-dependent epimerase/dehydratase family protein [Amycolatopsis pithecellobii]|uniref:NAD-dependent epimerase/dehydratase family protein n=1 Tax=Amycolatopsis pithecellobii TaxID=664692 RepID=A0A6N7YWS0_9PSEU|nr:NAD(P)-dependent oxidoreductase [Amycolatopsis pithecellobii]MTD57537.1 NAD-dependent epimerase/dehydratase family protein [Amycolatopsis pithecellobii]